MGRPFRLVTNTQRRALLVSLPVVLVGGAYAAWQGGIGKAPHRPLPGRAEPLASEADGIFIRNGAHGNFPVPEGLGSPPAFTLRPDAAMSQAVITRQGQGTGARHVLSLSIGGPAAVNEMPVVAALMLRLDLGPRLPAAPHSYRLDSAHVLGDALVVATQMPGNARGSRQVFRITDGLITVLTVADGRAMTARISLRAVTAVAAGGGALPATGHIQLGSTASVGVPLVLELDGGALGSRPGT